MILIVTSVILITKLKIFLKKYKIIVYNYTFHKTFTKGSKTYYKIIFDKIPGDK